MANDGFYTVTTDWTAVELESTDIQNGTFSVNMLTSGRVDLWKTDTAPTTEDIGPAFFTNPKDSNKYPISGSEKLYAKARETIQIGIVPAN